MTDPQMIPAQRWQTFFGVSSFSHLGKQVHIVEGDLMNEVPEGQYHGATSAQF